MVSNELEKVMDGKCYEVLLSMQKASGKKFITDDEVDKLVEEVIKEECKHTNMVVSEWHQSGTPDRWMCGDCYKDEGECH